MNLETAEIIIFRYYLQPCCSEKADPMTSRTPAPERATADRWYGGQNYTSAAPASIRASGTTAVPGPCLS